jgi:hypothetical protein
MNLGQLFESDMPTIDNIESYLFGTACDIDDSYCALPCVSKANDWFVPEPEDHIQTANNTDFNWDPALELELDPVAHELIFGASPHTPADTKDEAPIEPTTHRALTLPITLPVVPNLHSRKARVPSEKMLHVRAIRMDESNWPAHECDLPFCMDLIRSLDRLVRANLKRLQITCPIDHVFKFAQSCNYNGMNFRLFLQRDPRSSFPINGLVKLL